MGVAMGMGCTYIRGMKLRGLQCGGREQSASWLGLEVSDSCERRWSSHLLSLGSCLFLASARPGDVA